ncbi:MAG: hypothetical protein AAGB46_02335 [Verrucomicrobiota bacterium]
MSKSVVLSFLLGAALGGGYFFISSLPDRSDRIVNAIRVSELEAEIETLRSSEREAWAAKERLEEELMATKLGTPESVSMTVQSLEVGQVDDKRLEEGRKRMREFMAQHADNRLDALTRRLGLDADQRGAFDDLLALQADQRSDIKVAYMEGGKGASIRMSADKGSIVGQQDFDDLANEILSDDQLEAYWEFRDDENRSKWESMATSRLNSIAPSLGMTEEERDLAYAAFYEETRGMMEGPMTLEDRQALADARDTQLEEILGEERFEDYKELEGGDGYFSKRIQIVE